jgi:hypothetical protein
MNHPDHDDDFDYLQRIVITLDIPGFFGTDTIATAALLTVLTHLEHDGIRPTRTTLDISEPTTPPA